MKILEYPGVVAVVDDGGVAEIDIVTGLKPGEISPRRIRTFYGTRQLLPGQAVVVFTKEYSDLEKALGLLVLPLVILCGFYFLFFKFIGQKGWAAFITVLLFSPYFSYLWFLYGRLRSDPEYKLKSS